MHDCMRVCMYAYLHAYMYVYKYVCMTIMPAFTPHTPQNKPHTLKPPFPHSRTHTSTSMDMSSLCSFRAQLTTPFIRTTPPPSPRSTLALAPDKLSHPTPSPPPLVIPLPAPPQLLSFPAAVVGCDGTAGAVGLEFSKVTCACVCLCVCACVCV